MSYSMCARKGRGRCRRQTLDFRSLASCEQPPGHRLHHGAPPSAQCLSHLHFMHPECVCVFLVLVWVVSDFLNLSFSVNTVSRHRTHSLISIPVVFPAKGIFWELSCVLAVLFSFSSPPSFSLSKLKAFGYSKGYRQ